MTRTVNPRALQTCLLRDPHCVLCGQPSTDPHHVIFKSHQGDDVLSNLVALCRRHHDLIHQEDIVAKRALGDHILTHRWDTLAYLHHKLGLEWRDWYQRRLGIKITIGEETHV